MLGNQSSLTFVPFVLQPFYPSAQQEFNTNKYTVAAEPDDPLDVLLNKCFYKINKRTLQQLPIKSGPASVCALSVLINNSS